MTVQSSISPNLTNDSCRCCSVSSGASPPMKIFRGTSLLNCCCCCCWAAAFWLSSRTSTRLPLISCLASKMIFLKFLSAMVTNPKPLDRLVSLSFMTNTSLTSQNCSKYERTSSSLQSGRPPTKNLLQRQQQPTQPHIAINTPRRQAGHQAVTELCTLQLHSSSQKQQLTSLGITDRPTDSYRHSSLAINKHGYTHPASPQTH
mmetsp:Transcript_232/g.752  ORF Transcript_232/g.752 Transcript_232/m.752 type:complete len:203 (-) Transcript_232:505-1113(-)